MQQAAARLIIEGAPLAPGILTILSQDDQGKLHHVAHRLRALGTVIGLLTDQATEANNFEGADVLAHIGNTVDDISQLADALVKRETAS